MDEARRECDELLAKVEKKIQQEYSQAAKEVDEKLKKYLEGFAGRDKKMREKLTKGIIIPAEYKDWRYRQMATGKRWYEMLDTLTKDLEHSREIAQGIVNEHMIDTYAVSHNYGMFEVEKTASVETLFTLYDHETVAMLVAETPNLLPKFDEGKVEKAKRWNRAKIDSAVTQGVLQGESIPNIAKRLRTVVDMDYKQSIRTARTATTAAESMGRYDSYAKAEAMGIKGYIGWQATLDGRTRHSHRQVDGEMVRVGEKFSNKLRFPGDPQGEPAEVYNCRCAPVFLKADSSQALSNWYALRNTEINNMSYEEWKKATAVQKKKVDKAFEKETKKIKKQKEPARPKEPVQPKKPVNQISLKDLEEEYKQKDAVLKSKIEKPIVQKKSAHEKYMERAEKQLEALKKETEQARNGYIDAVVKSGKSKDEAIRMADELERKSREQSRKRARR